MVTTQVARETVYQAFVDGIGLPVAQYTFANENFTPPPSLPWVRLSVQHQTGNQETLGAVGNRRFERAGQITMQIFVVKDDGLRDMDALIATCRGLFEGRTLTGPIRCTDADVQEIGNDGPWFQVNIDVNFAYEETR